MASEPSLDTAVHHIVAEYRRLRAVVSQQQTLLDEQATRLEKLETQNAELRASIDALNADRFSLKKLRDERKVVHRKVHAALTRMETLEREVNLAFED